MDTISRENNSSSMLPVGGIIIGVVALLFGAYAAVALRKITNTVAAQEEKIAKIDGIESQISGAAADAAKANKSIADYARQTQEGFNTVGNELAKLREEMTRVQESQKKPAVAAGRKSSEPVVAGPGEYVVKVGDTSGTKIANNNNVSIADLKAVNPDVDWNHLKVGQKLKLPAK